MKAFRLTGIRQMAMMDVPMPSVQHENDVLIRLATMGVCGSDVHYFVDGGIGSQIVQYPWTVGHEASGVVEAVGTAVSRVKPGDRIAIDPAISCFQCDQCRAGRPHTCRKLKFLGCPGQIEGCLSEYVVMPEPSCYPVPHTMTFQQAANVEPLSIGVYGVSLGTNVTDATVGILGSGPIGICAQIAARERGASKIFVTDKIDARLDIAKKMGADWVGNANEPDIVDTITSVEPALLDTVVECCGQQDAIDTALKLLKPGGQLLIIGIPLPNRLSFDINLLRRKELRIQNVRRQNNCVQRSLDMIASGRAKVDGMVTHHLPFGRADQAFDLVAGYKDGVVKAMIDF
jgi:L-iditol 2-dehydrogenase